jgi:hypothetical protein
MAYGSLINAYSGTKVGLVPEVGMGATELFWTDRHAATVIEVSASGKSIKVQSDKAIRTDNQGMSDAQSYRYEPNPNGAISVYTLRKNGQWVLKGDPLRGGQRLGLGYRRHYHDYSF